MAAGDGHITLGVLFPRLAAAAVQPASQAQAPAAGDPVGPPVVVVKVVVVVGVAAPWVTVRSWGHGAVMGSWWHPSVLGAHGAPGPGAQGEDGVRGYP